MLRKTLRTGAAVMALGFAFATSAPALANDADVIKRGNCSGATDWKLKAKPDDGRLEVEGEVDSNKRGQDVALGHRPRRQGVCQGSSHNSGAERLLLDRAASGQHPRRRPDHLAVGQRTQR